MRPCEYLLTSKNERKKTKIIVLGGVRFFKNKRVLSFFDSSLHNADFVSVTFYDQKNGQKIDTRNVDRVQGARDLCCVRALAETCQRIAKYKHPKAILERNICTFQNQNGTFIDITSRFALKLLRSGTERMGFERLGFGPKEVGCHSIRSGGAMAYYLLPGMSDTKVMFKGRWKSTAFMKYIRPQVDQFMEGHATKIVENKHWYNIPSLDPSQISNIDWRNNADMVDGGAMINDVRLVGAPEGTESVEMGVNGRTWKSKKRPLL